VILIQIAPPQDGMAVYQLREDDGSLVGAMFATEAAVQQIKDALAGGNGGGRGELPEDWSSTAMGFEP